MARRISTKRNQVGDYYYETAEAGDIVEFKHVVINGDYLQTGKFEVVYVDPGNKRQLVLRNVTHGDIITTTEKTAPFVLLSGVASIGDICVCRKSKVLNNSEDVSTVPPDSWFIGMLVRRESKKSFTFLGQNGETTTVTLPDWEMNILWPQESIEDNG